MSEDKEKINMRYVNYHECNEADWKVLIKAMHSGKEVLIHDSVWWYFLGVLPPKWMGSGLFVFAEGADRPVLFAGYTADKRFCQEFPTWQALVRHLALYSIRLPLEKISIF